MPIFSHPEPAVFLRRREKITPVLDKMFTKIIARKYDKTPVGGGGEVGRGKSNGTPGDLPGKRLKKTYKLLTYDFSERGKIPVRYSPLWTAAGVSTRR